jgi:hypothetical protein
MTVRTDIVKGDGFAWAGYLEGGYKGKRLSFYMREGIFFVDAWNDRIYIYERDIPGYYNVPAMYGRGMWSSVTGTYQFSNHVKANLRAAYTCYPFMKEKKPGKAELKFQLSFRF